MYCLEVLINGGKYFPLCEHEDRQQLEELVRRIHRNFAYRIMEQKEKSESSSL